MIGYKQVTARKDHKCDWCSGTIQTGEVYEKQVIITDGSASTWKNHRSCMEIASQLKMFEWVDDGVTGDDFREHINCAYERIMSDMYNDLYESKDFKIPSFQERLDFVKKHHNIV